MFPRRSSAAKLAILGIVLLSSFREAPALDHVVLQLKWRHQFQFAGYYAAIEQGYYREAGLDVELREAVPEIDPVHQVLDGKADFGIGTSNILLLRAHGEPIVVLAVVYQHSPFVLLTTAESGIRDIHDLADQPILMEPDAAELLAYFKSEGVDPARLKILPHSFDVRDLIDKKAAAMSAYATDEPYHLKAAGVEYQTFSPRAGGIDFYGDNLFTTEKQVKEHGVRVRNFLQASLRGWEYAMRHPEEMVDLILRKYDRGKSREQLLFEAEETARLVHPELIELGYVNPGRWENIARAYASLGMIPRNFNQKGFIFERNPGLDLRWLYWAGGGLLAVLLGSSGWAMLITHWNRRLRKEVVARKRAEEVSRSQSEQKTQVLAVLAHEVRSPLSGILSSLWLHRQSKSDAARQEVLDIAEESASHLLRLVDNILDHAKAEAGRMQVELEPVFLPDLIQGICSLFRASASAKDVTVRHTIDESVPTTILSDPMRLRQILSNLMSNAVKFTSAGSVSLTVDAKIEQNDKYRVSFQVSDSGPGLHPEQISRIFEPYTQADSSVGRHYGGTGLGLSISSQLARLLGGEITVESKPGLGSVFTLSISAATQAHHPIDPASKTTANAVEQLTIPGTPAST